MSANTANVVDVARYILSQPGFDGITTMKLQKLCFYAQSWHLALQNAPLFSEDFQAWANGPVCYTLFAAHRRQFTAHASDFSQGNASKISRDSQAVIDEVLSVYGDLSGTELGRLSHSEAPWTDARVGLPLGATSSAVITKDSMEAQCRRLLASAS